MFSAKPRGDLLGRPVLLQSAPHIGKQHRVRRKPGRFGATPLIPRGRGTVRVNATARATDRCLDANEASVLETWDRENRVEPRINYGKVAPAAYHAMSSLEAYVRESGLEKGLLELVKIRASQINNCAYCLDMHTKDARAAGESEQRLYALTAWRETPFYTDRERAALLWTETLTRLSQNDVPDEVFEEVRGQFSEEELVNLSMAVVAINGWNRLAVGFRSVPGTYEPRRH
jgi:AhpD family alkylhydroperoxidase